MNRRLAAILAADVVGYSRLMEEDEAVALGVIRDLKKIYLEPTILQYDGEVLKRMGDGWIVAFSSISAAVQCAMETQKKLVGNSLIRMRIGGHIGEIVFEETDFHGASVNLAQRLETEAPPGGLMISQDLYRQLSLELSKEFTDAGSFKLKNIALPVDAFQWRPQHRRARGDGDVPCIAVEKIEPAPDESETRAAAADLRDQLILRLSRRTGVRVLDEGAGGNEQSEYILRGRLRLTKDRGRLFLTLVLRAQSRPVWSQSYEGDTSDMLRFCDDLIQRADADLRLQINAFDAERLVELSDGELSVSELRSRAAHYFYKLTLESWDHALRLIERALQLNPNDPMALAMRSEAVVGRAAARYDQLSNEWLDGLRVDLDHAVELSPRSDYVFFARGNFRALADTDYAGAKKDAERALTLNPSYSSGYDLLGCIHLAHGTYNDAVESFAKALSFSESDPNLPYRIYFQAVSLLCAHRPRQAAEKLEQAIQLRPNQWAYHRLQAICYQQAGDDTAAEKAELRASCLPREPSLLAYRPPLPHERIDLLDLLSPRSNGDDEELRSRG